MGCAHSSSAVEPAAEEIRYDARGTGKNKVAGLASLETHDHGSKDTSETLPSSLESQVDTVKFIEVPSPIQEYLPPPELHWKLSLEEIEHQRALNRLDEIKSLGLAILEVPKCRVCLISCTHLWISTRTGAFSPALQVEGAPWQGSFDHFYLDNRTDPFIMEDARLDPRCANHPGVRGRPNIRFYVGVPLLSRGHFIGLYYLADSQPRPQPSPEQISQLVGIAEDSVAALQEDMFKCLLNEETETENGNTTTDDATADRKISANTDNTELPAVWIDVLTPKWHVVGANAAWEKLTGVSYLELKDCRGLLEVMIPSNEGGLLRAVDAAAQASTSTSPGASVPAILSPCAPNGVSLQYIFAIKPAGKDEKPPTSLISNTATTRENIWIAEVHARIQAAADLTGNLEIDPSGMTHRSLPTDPYFGTLLKEKIIPAASATYNYQYSYQRPYPAAPPPTPFTTNSHGAGSSSNSGSGGTISNHSSSTAKPMTTASKSVGIDSLDSSQLFISATSLLELGSMHIPPRLATLQIGPILGKGSYGSVYWGMLGDNGVAIKVMQQAPGPEAEEQLWAAEYEAMVASDLAHDNLVRTIDWCCQFDGPMSGGVMWIVQELCNKGSLAIAIKEGALREGQVLENPPDMHAVLDTAVGVARGMAYLHSHDVLHGDLSSNNVLFISADNECGFRAKVTDFGLSRALGGQDIATKTVGTVSHMPPELLTSGVMAKTGDVYSMGVMLWELYTGKRAWAGSSQAQVIFAITCKNERLQMPSDAPARYAALTTACMDPDRSKRPGFDEILRELDVLLAELPPKKGDPAAAGVSE